MNGYKPGSIYAKRIAKIQDHFYSYVDKICNTRSRRPNYIVKRTVRRPAIDGQCNEPQWKQANVLDLVHQTNAKPASVKTQIQMLHDDKYLYIMIEADEPAMKKLVAKAEANDSFDAPYIWEDDAVEIFIAPDRDKPDSYGQIIINTKGVFLDGWFGSPKHYAKSYEFDWNSNVKCQIRRKPKGWSMEIAIPLAKLSVDGPVGSEWTMNLCRDRAAGGKEHSSWSATLSDDRHRPSRFGFITLEK